MASETLDEKKSQDDGSGPVDDEEEPMEEDEEEPATPAAAAAAEEEEEGGEDGEEEAEEEEGKRGRKRGVGEKKNGDGDAEEEKKQKKRRRGSVVRERATPAVERPSRERKAVERYTASASRSASSKKVPSILQGSGTKLKDIPNVSFKLSKRRIDENLQVLHTILFGRKSNAHYLKRNISQFSGFVWGESEEKQKARLKEKLDKCNKERLLDFCELLDIHVNKATTKKEEISAKLVEFLESPHVTRDVILSETPEKGKKRRRAKGITPATLGEASPDKESKRKGYKRSVEAENENEDEGGSADSAKDASIEAEDNEESDEESEHAKSEQENEESEPEEPTASNKRASKKEKTSTGKKAASANSSRSSKVVPKKVEVEDEPDAQLESKKTSKASTKRRNVVKKGLDKTNKGVPDSSSGKKVALDDHKSSQSTVSKSRKEDQRKGQSKTTANKNTKSIKKQVAKVDSKVSTKKQGKGKASRDANSGPSTEELHAVISKILKQVDFNTATLADILRQLGIHFNVDMMDRKAEVKRIIEDVINSMTDDEEESEDDDNDGGDDAGGEANDDDGGEEDHKEDSDADDDK
ncbi:protein DEK-like [Ananas comosus]|uniref:Protein DEK-like n=1 Tax=Ananas comosus TaxID=4615 RepID=A0A6P5GZQ1_ANACO|nr:protein DEK-like [Ananas comosus]